MFRRYGLWLYLAGAAAARAGDEVSGPALLLAGLAVTGTVSEASSLLAGITISAAVGGPVFGALLDRLRRPGRLLAVALIVYAGTLAVVLVSLGRIPIVLVVTIAALGGLVGPALSGGWTAQLPRVVAPGNLPRANALDAMTFNTANLVGPVLAGAMAVLSGASSSVVLAFVLITLAVPVAWCLPANGEQPCTCSPVSVLGGLIDGFRVIVRVRPLARATLTSVLSCLGMGMLLTCSSLLGKEAFGSPNYGVFLLSAVASASLIANAALARHPGSLRPDALLCTSTLLLAVALLLTATVSPVLIPVAVVIAGFGEGPQLSSLFAIRHRESPNHLRGQIFTTGASLKITGFALGSGVAGPLAAWSLPGALSIAAGCELLAAVAFAVLTLTDRVTRPRSFAASAGG